MHLPLSTRACRTARWAAALALAAIAPLASANTVLSFDDIADGAIPANYGGLDWSASAWTAFDGSDASYPYTPHSGNKLVTLGWDGTDADSLIRFGQDVVFEGAWFSGYAEGDVTFQLFHQGALVATSATLASSDVSSFLASGYAGLVDAVAITSSGHAFYAMDDFSFSATASTVPEPATAVLMLAGLGVLGLSARRRG